MKINRRQFNFRLTSALLGLSAIPQLHAQGSTDSSGSPSGTARRPYFFKDPTFEIIFLTCLGGAYHSGGDVGKVLYLTRQVEDGNFESAFLAFKQAGDEARALAEESESDGHNESVRQAYLWAQNFFDSATYFVDGSKDPTRFLPTWELLYDCWLKALAHFDPPIEPVSIPYENTELHGFFIRGTNPSRRRPFFDFGQRAVTGLCGICGYGEGAGALVRGESFWPGQSRQLYNLLGSPKKLVSFSESDGADLHCEPKGTGLRDLRVFNWLDQTLGTP